MSTGHTQERMFAPLAENQTAAATWGRGGRGYDAISRQIADAIEHSVDRLAPRSSECVLDVATGTGWTARRVAARGAAVHGVDFAEGVIEAAKQLATPRTRFSVADAEALPFADGDFDAVISTFGVMFCGQPERAASELARVCRKGGRLALATWPPHGGVFEMFSVIKPYVAKAPAASPFDWGRPEGLEKLLGQWFELGIEEGTTYYRETNAEAAWEVFVDGYGPTRTLAAQLGEDDRRRLREDWIEFHKRYETPLGVLVPRPYVITVGRRR